MLAPRRARRLRISLFEKLNGPDPEEQRVGIGEHEAVRAIPHPRILIEDIAIQCVADHSLLCDSRPDSLPWRFRSKLNQLIQIIELSRVHRPKEGQIEEFCASQLPTWRWASAAYA